MKVTNQYLLEVSTSSSSFSLPLTKDVSTLQYLTTFSYGTPLVPTNLILDLGGPFLWLDCSSPPTTPSSSLSAIFLRSICCLTTKSPQIETYTWLSSLANPADQDHPCHIPTENTITGKRVFKGELVEDLMISNLHTPMNMIQVPLMATFGLCFKSNGIGISQVGPNVPVIDLVMRSEMVK
ncbi:hypothetical protein RJT34_25396 [Clitoria ternatea]|uniref:Xylanase inhibitor N-terminal domain-containing protein n=1 Tax=Clitoria ternatea TaxID=43366 RepID=A0AAN9FWH1_CLITE